MQIKATLALLAVAAGAASASVAQRGTLPTFLDLQAKYYKGAISPAELSELTTLGQQLHAQGAPLDKIVGTGAQGQQLYSLLGLNVASLLTPSSAPLAARRVVMPHEKPHAVDAPQQVGLVPAFILAVNEVLGANGAPAPAAVEQMLSYATQLLAQGTTVSQLAKMVGTAPAGLAALEQIKGLPAAQQQQKRGAADGIPAHTLLTPPAKGAAVPEGTIPAFQYYVSQIWAAPLSAMNAAPLAKVVELGQAIRAESGERALVALLGDTKPANIILAQIRTGGAAGHKRHMQKKALPQAH